MAKVIMGLGNPGEEYEATYHNVGILALRAIAAQHAEAHGPDARSFKKHKDLFAYASVGDAAFVVPLTFMNVSGSAAKEALKKFHASPEGVTVLHDESDLTVGSYKIARGQGAAGHKGVQSIMDAIGSNEFTRVRIGIRPAQEAVRKKAGDFVLSTITPKDRAEFVRVFGEVARALSL